MRAKIARHREIQNPVEDLEPNNIVNKLLHEEIGAETVKYDEITYIDVINKKLNVMDTTATSLCMDNNIPIIVFDINKKDNLKKIINGENIGTIVKV